MIQQEIVLIRHTSVEFPRGFCYGNLDIDVSSQFNIEAEWLKDKIENFNPDVVYSSPLKRCTNLCSFVYNDYKCDDRLKEFNYGDWEGKTWEEINVPESSDWIFFNPTKKTPNGESFEDLQSRVMSFINEITHLNHKKIIIFCHGGVIRSIISNFLGLPLMNSKALKIHYVAQIKLEKTNNFWRLSELNSGF